MISSEELVGENARQVRVRFVVQISLDTCERDHVFSQEKMAGDGSFPKGR